MTPRHGRGIFCLSRSVPSQQPLWPVLEIPHRGFFLFLYCLLLWWSLFRPQVLRSRAPPPSSAQLWAVGGFIHPLVLSSGARLRRCTAPLGAHEDSLISKGATFRWPVYSITVHSSTLTLDRSQCSQTLFLPHLAYWTTDVHPTSCLAFLFAVALGIELQPLMKQEVLLSSVLNLYFEMGAH